MKNELAKCSRTARRFNRVARAAGLVGLVLSAGTGCDSSAAHGRAAAGERLGVSLAELVQGAHPSFEFPLHTRGRYIVDRSGNRFKLAAVNWYGASDVDMVPGGLDRATLPSIVSTIQSMGFNAVRLPFSNAMLRATSVNPKAIAANADLAGLSPLEVYDRVVRALTAQGVAVVLNNHSTHAMWCCNYDDDGLWYTKDWSEDDWVNDWNMMVRRYAGNPGVVGADLRNEVRIAKLNGTILPNPPQWAHSPNDWRAAAEHAGNSVLQENPAILVIVEGINFPRTHLRGVAMDPIRLNVPNRLVYAAHNYGYIGPQLDGQKYGDMDWPTFKAQMDAEWGYVVGEGQAFTAPVWVSEFGESIGQTNRQWFNNIVRYLGEGDFDFAYWAINAGPKPSGDVESFSLVDLDWHTPLKDFRTEALAALVPSRRGPGVEPDWDTQPAHHFDPLVFADWDTNRASEAWDWYGNSFKATCAEGSRVVGLSQGQRAGQRFNHEALCSSWGLSLANRGRRAAADDGHDTADARAHTEGTDWDPGFTKLECGKGEYVAGLSQTRSQLSYRLPAILCADSGTSLQGPCVAVPIGDGDHRRSDLGGDWDNGGEKAQCAEGEYVAGVSSREGAPHALLCCAP